MWRRLKRMVQANLGRLAPAGGSAADVLRRQADDMARELPALDSNLATIRAEATVSEERLRRLHRRDEELVALMAAAQARGALERAAEYTTELASVRREAGEVEAHLARVRTAIEAAGRTKDALRAARERKLEEAREVARNLAELEREDARIATPRAHELDPTPEAGLDAPVVASPADAPRAPVHKTLGPAPAPPAEPAARDAGKTLGPEPSAPDAPATPSAKTFGPAPGVAPASGAAASVAPASSPPAGSRPLDIKVRAVVRGAAEPSARVETPAAEAAPTRSPAEPGGDLVSELERLGRLRAAGALTDDELALAKKKLLGGATPRGAS